MSTKRYFTSPLTVWQLLSQPSQVLLKLCAFIDHIKNENTQNYNNSLIKKSPNERR